MVSKTDDIPASVPDCSPVDLADEAGDAAQDIRGISKTGLKDSCGGGEDFKLLLQIPSAFRALACSLFKAPVHFWKVSIPV